MVNLSLFLYFMKGPHDDELTSPLEKEFEVKKLVTMDIIQRLWIIKMVMMMLLVELLMVT